MYRLTGGCHCGALTVVFETTIPAGQLPLRACDCSFCRKHGVRTTSDPSGRLTFIAVTPESLQRYRFGTRTASTLICRNCGIYVGAAMEIEGGYLAVVNANALGDQTPFSRVAEPMGYERETADARIARRREKWTPAEIATSS